ncbi:unnamed protein product, partial [Rangifer tarandus platyrhynchus]
SYPLGLASLAATGVREFRESIVASICKKYTTIKSPTHEQVPFRQHVFKSNLFVKSNKVSL